MLRKGANKGEIARALYRDKSTIKREIKRGSVKQRRRDPYESKDPKRPEHIEYMAYFADAGQRVYKERRGHSGGKNKVAACADLVMFVESKALGAEKWSPDAAIGYAKRHNLYPGRSFAAKTFCNWMKKRAIDIAIRHICFAPIPACHWSR
jgi:IS30 family transposase